MASLICPICGLEQDAGGPGVGSARDEGRPSAQSRTYWVPFIEDLRGDPWRLVHPSCFVRERSLDELLAAVTEHDRRTRMELSRSWQSR